MKENIHIQINASSKAEAAQVQKAFETMHRYFGAKGIIKMEQLFLNDAFIRNLVQLKINKK